MDDMDRLIKRCADENGCIDKRMLHARGVTDANLFGPDDANPSPLEGLPLVKGKGFSVTGELRGRPYWVAVFWRGELEDQVQIRGWDADWVTEELTYQEGNSFSLTPVGPYYELRLDSPLSILTALLELGGRDAVWQGDKPPGLPRHLGCIPPIEP